MLELIFFKNLHPIGEGNKKEQRVKMSITQKGLPSSMKRRKRIRK